MESTTTNNTQATLPLAPAEPHAVAEQDAPRGRGRFFREIGSGRFWRPAAFLLSGLPLGVFWFVLIIPLVVVSSALLITVVGIPLAAMTMFLLTRGARSERWRIAKFLNVEIQPPYQAFPEGASLFRKLWLRVKDRAIWKDLVYIILLLPVTIIEFVLGILVVVLTVALMMIPVRPSTSILLALSRAHGAFGRWLLGSNRERELEKRVSTLTESRSRVIDAVAEERRRIERDLHDGAQQRLVALAMDLGMAREKMQSDPDAAQNLVEEAHVHAKFAISEMRELVRGIHPAVLTDRGLDAAISALAGRSPVPVTVEVNLPDRLPDAIETNAYYVVSEALTNVAKHSHATKARVIVRREKKMLVIEVADDGIGGAALSESSGLSGLRDRIVALDGTLRVSSPAGGPTWIRADMPCES